MKELLLALILADTLLLTALGNSDILAKHKTMEKTFKVECVNENNNNGSIQSNP